MYHEYLKKILPIPVKEIQVSPKNNYLYMVTTYASVINEKGTENLIDLIVNKCKKIKKISYWRNKPNDTMYKQAVVEFIKE